MVSMAFAFGDIEMIYYASSCINVYQKFQRCYCKLESINYCLLYE